MTRRMEHLEAQACDGNFCPVAEFVDLVRLGEVRRASRETLEQLPSLQPHGPQRVGQQHPILWMHPAGRGVRAAQRRYGEHVIEVTMGEHHRYRLEPVLNDQLCDTGNRVHTGIDDHALLAKPLGNEVTVGLPRPGGKGGYEHTFETIGTIGQD